MMRYIKQLISTLAVVFALIPFTAQSAEKYTQYPYQAGFSTATLPDPMGGNMRYGIWYPTADEEGIIRLGPFAFPGTQDAQPAAGKFPLVVISHGSEGTYLGHRNIALALARRGIIAAAVLHPRDNFRDASGTGHRIVWDGRPRQISALIDVLLKDVRWGKLIAQNKVGAFGFSLGGYTVLSLLGAEHNLPVLIAHCQKHGANDPICELRGGLASAMQSIYKAEYEDSAAVASHYDQRVRVALVADPVAAVFTKESLSVLADVPLKIYLPEYGDALTGQFHGGRVHRLLAQQQRQHPPELQQVAAAKHMGFLAPFPQEVALTIPGLLEHADGFDWEAFQQQFAVEVADYFVAKFKQ